MSTQINILFQPQVVWAAVAIVFFESREPMHTILRHSVLMHEADGVGGKYVFYFTLIRFVQFRMNLFSKWGVKSHPKSFEAI